MKAKTRIFLLVMGWWLCISTGCQPAPTETQPATPSLAVEGTFVPYRTLTPTFTATQPTTTPPTSTPIPTATPTPRTHVVKAGEDLSGIALHYKVPLADLKTANPTVNPRLMKVGTLLIIPGSGPLPTNQAAATVTPRPVGLSTAACLLDLAGGAWCFVLVKNQSAAPLINVTVSLRLMDASGKQVAKQSVSLPLDLLPAGSALPLAAYFPSPMPDSYQVLVDLESALPASSSADHYPRVEIAGLQSQMDAQGTSVRASGKVALAEGQSVPSQLSVVIVAYTADGRVAGLRRWDTASVPAPGKPVDFQVTVYSAGGSIDHIAAFAEARK